MSHTCDILHTFTNINVLSLKYEFYLIPILPFFLRCILLLFVLFFVPGVVMITAYGLISRELYRGIQFELEQKKGQCGEALQLFIHHHQINLLVFN